MAAVLTRSPARVRWLEWTLAGALLALLVAEAWKNIAAGWAFTTDDAYITLRYARHLADGHGVVWNVGEAPPVEGYSNFLYVVLGAASMLAHVDPIGLFKALGVASLAGTVLVTWWLARTWVGPFVALLPGLFLVTYQGELFWVTSGLETPVFQFLVVAATGTFVRALGYRAVATRDELLAPATGVDLRWLATSAALAFLACLTRPDGAVVALALAVALLARARFAPRPWLVVGLVFVLPIALYHGWRLAHFGALLPHSVVCKLAYSGDPNVLTRDYWHYAAPFALLALAHPWRRLDVRHALLWLIPLGYAALLHGADPIIGYWNRHALAAVALLLVVAVAGLSHIAAFVLAPLGRAWREVLLGFGAVIYVSATVSDFSEPLRRDAAHYARRMEVRAELSTWLADHTKPEDWILMGDVGRAVYDVDANVIDAFCLNCREMSAPPISFSAERFADAVMARAPAVLVVHSARPDRLVPRGEYGVYPAIVAHPAFRRDYQQAATFGASGDAFHYWVYLRRP